MESLPLCLGQEDEERFADEKVRWEVQQGRCGVIGLLDSPYPIGYQVTVRGEVEQLLVALALHFHDLASSEQLLVLLAQFLFGHIQFLQGDVKFLNNIYQ